MPDFDDFEIDSFSDDPADQDSDDYFNLDDTVIDQSYNQSGVMEDKSLNNGVSSSARRSSADFSPDMDMLLLTAQSPMIIEGMRLVLKHDFKSTNISHFSEAVRGVDLYIKIIQRNPANFQKLTAALNKDTDCIEVQQIAYNLFKNAYGEPADSDSRRLKAFELLKDTLQNGYCKSLISLSLIQIKQYFLMTGDPDFSKIDFIVSSRSDGGVSEFARLEKHVAIARNLLKTKNFEINKGMKGREINVFIVKASRILAYFYTKTGYQEKSVFYTKMHDNFKKYFVVK